ncbi:OsmC family protein [Sulfurimonas sp. MAG313]|nr:OsmC family protein [Sulfurimonas sp. MAG313]MDF1881539.1 OsmC family protein [Sulfurimonas sp. MAG313]
MNVKITHQDGMKFEAKTSKSSFIIDCPSISPIEYFLAGIICCTATDIIMVPKKQGIEVTNLEVDGDVVRAEEMPQKFDSLHLSYSFNSPSEDDIVVRWVMASIETYCSTLNTIRGVTKITYSITHNEKLIRDKSEIISGETPTDFGKLEGCCPS